MASIRRLVCNAQFQDLATAAQAANVAKQQSLGNPGFDFKERLAALAEKRPPKFGGLQA